MTGEFGSERLVQKVGDTILFYTAEAAAAEPVAMETDEKPADNAAADDTALNHAIPTKIILEGQQVP